MSLEYLSWDFLGNFDELHMNYTSKEINEYWFHRGYTLGYFSFAGGNKKVAPMIVADGELQGKVQNPVMVEVDGKKYPIFYYENDTHKNNQHLYEDYLKHGVASNLVTDTFFSDFLPNVVLPAFPNDSMASNFVGCIVDDKASLHWTDRIHDLLTKHGVTHILCPCTKVGQPNDFGIHINGWIRKKILQYIFAWLTDRIICASKGETVPPLTHKLLMSKHLVLSINLFSNLDYFSWFTTSVVCVILFYARIWLGIYRPCGVSGSISGNNSTNLSTPRFHSQSAGS